jgi:toxin-antitoxin system PIN domain toxin
VIAPDINVLLYALREESERHVQFRTWLERALNGSRPVALFEPVLASVFRIATHPAIYRPATPRVVVEKFLDACLAAPAALAVRTESGHWAQFRELCEQADCRGNLVQDAYLAALALEHNCTYVTTDRDFARFPGLRWQHPLDQEQPIQNPRIK